MVEVPARAEPAAETSYGRIDGDLSVTLGVGATFGPRAVRAAADARLRYLSTAGIFATYEGSALLGNSSDPQSVLATGVELRPLFFARWLQGLETGNARVDLTIDSLAFELGAAFVAGPNSGFDARPALQAGLGLTIPFLSAANGPVFGIHGGARWSEATLAGNAADHPRDRAAFLTLTLAWEQVVGTRVVGLGDPAPR